MRRSVKSKPIEVTVELLRTRHVFVKARKAFVWAHTEGPEYVSLASIASFSDAKRRDLAAIREAAVAEHFKLLDDGYGKIVFRPWKKRGRKPGRSK